MKTKDLKKLFIELTGENPEDVLGPDWELYAEEYMDDKRDEK